MPAFWDSILTAAAVANSFSVPNVSCDDDDIYCSSSEQSRRQYCISTSLYTYLIELYNSKLYG